MGGILSVFLVASQHLPTIRMVSCHLQDSIRTLLSYPSKGLGNPEKFRSDVTFLLILTKGCIVEDRVYGLSMMWVHPYQARVSVMEEAVKQLTPLISTGPDWPTP